MKPSIVSRAIALSAVATLSLVGCAAQNEQAASGSNGNSPAGAVAGSENLSGSVQAAGASTQKVAQDAWIAKFTSRHPDVTLSYNPIGSGGGRERFANGAIGFGGTDAALDGQELGQARQRCGGVDKLIEMPVYISPIAVAYNLPQVQQQLKLTPTTIANIFRGRITKWNDPAIAKTNPGVTLPDTGITPVHRSDDSGTTENFVDYLSGAAGAAWPFEVSGNWPIPGGEAAQGTSGVVGVVEKTPGAITYADASQARNLSAVQVRVGQEFVGPSSKAAAKILEASQQTDTKGRYVFTYDLARDTAESGTYPVVLTSYEMACAQYDSAQTAGIVQAYLEYVISEQGQQLAAQQAGSAPLSPGLRDKLTPAVQAIAGSA